MRSDRIATCTSGEPVSPGLMAYSPISVCLRSAVIDIGFLSSATIDHAQTIDDAHRPKSAMLDPHQRDKKLIQPRTDDRAVGDVSEARPVARITRRHLLTVTQSSRFFCRQGE